MRPLSTRYREWSDVSKIVRVFWRARRVRLLLLQNELVPAGEAEAVADAGVVDPDLFAEKGNAWTPLPPLATEPTPFADSATQTTFVGNFITDSNTLADRALGGENSDQLIAELQHFVAQSDKFAMGHAQTSTVFNARFENEIAREGTSGTAANSLIEGLQNHDMGEVAAAANQLITNASDFAGNNVQANGDNYDAVIQAATGSTAPFIALQGGHQHDRQPANIQSTGEDVGHHFEKDVGHHLNTDAGHHSDLASSFAQFWHHA